ncbi:hypothetical protein [Amaricoccus solimangrovi]|uniref:Secreted protein n=1 Tax=Amaricoccus solimangrovi TaxID=2589815 RepID=A0A501WZU0_9RHOB|nr:hypothetical protein [Amaricoccus solimangrovi]TPE52691.1 hypothetical protein FJM51_05830 [Amaricoccus solimangrovi]
MPALPLSPLAWMVLRYGAVAAATMAASRLRPSQPKDPAHETVLDDLPEGVHARTHRAEGENSVHGHGKFRRVLRLRRGGPGMEFDGALLGRFRLRRVR